MGAGKQKIAILGGGMGSLTTAFELTNVPDWQDKYEITVYQLGWRLGGKGASGRAEHFRIEEHGLHVWMGFYDNSFRAIQACYKEMGRPAGAPLATWQDAFKKHSFIVVDEHIKGERKNWTMMFPENGLEPGSKTELPELHECVKMVMHYFREHFVKVQLERSALLVTEHPDGGIFQRLLGNCDRAVEVSAMAAGSAMLFAADAVFDTLTLDWKAPEGFIELLEKFLAWLWQQIEKCIDGDDELRRLWIMADLMIASILGLLFEGVLSGEHDLDWLDKYDFREWLKKYGASELSYNSGATEALYDLVFGYINGDPANQNFGAGVSVRSSLRIGLTYKGSVFYKMQAGMGDTVFTPLYEVLKKRGVTFKFFHRVRNLALSEDKTQIEKIQIGRQATVKNGDYDPLIDCLDLACWPSDPNFDQLVEGEELRAKKINLESMWAQWPDVEAIELVRGVDFDLVVQGISLGAMPYICPELIAANERWKQMVDNVLTVRTQAMQLWLSKDIKELGWSYPSPVLDGYAQPMNTWADMSQLICRESWEAPNTVKSIAYYCGPMIGGIPPLDDPDAPKKAEDEVRAAGQQWLEANSGFLWPNGCTPGSTTDLDWSLLVDSNGGTGVERYNAQFARANIDPSERYVLSVSGSLDYRIEPGNSGFSNLFLTGDWTRNGFNAGCIEATVMAGMLCSNAICGLPLKSDIVGFEKL